jgi:polyhydroxyalkanoate synthesis regulator phasin
MSENNFNDVMKKVMYSGIGLVALSVDMLGKAVETLAARGEEAVQKGKVMNEELKRRREAAKANAKEVSEALEKMTREEVAAIKAKLLELEQTLEKAGRNVILNRESISGRLEEMSREDIEVIKAKLAEIEKKWADDGDKGAEG